jgi:hypothetical protein
MPHPRETPTDNELLPGHKRFTVYAKYTVTDDDGQPDYISIEELDIDADDQYQAIEFACEVLTRDYEPGFEIMVEHTTERFPGELYL